MEEKDSIYQVLRDLADFVREHRVTLTEEEMPAPVEAVLAAPDQPDENAAFLEAMKDVRRVDRTKERIRGSLRDNNRSGARGEDVRIMEEILKADAPFSVINLPEYMEGYVDGTSPLVIEKLRNGEFSIQKVLDLHGLSAHDACDVFHAFLGEAVQSGFRCVRIIHGRGLKSRRGPVLKEKLKEWIVRAMHRKWVVAFASCRMADGGPGATTILLRAHAHKKKLHIIG